MVLAKILRLLLIGSVDSGLVSQLLPILPVELHLRRRQSDDDSINGMVPMIATVLFSAFLFLFVGKSRSLDPVSIHKQAPFAAEAAGPHPVGSKDLAVTPALWQSSTVKEGISQIGHDLPSSVFGCGVLTLGH